VEVTGDNAEPCFGDSRHPHLGEMTFTMLIVDQVDKSLHEPGVVGRIVVTHRM
jgi:hypothetical protein